MKVIWHCLSILMNGFLVGELQKTSKSELIFNYDKSWLDMPGSRPISLSMPLVNKAFTGDLVYNFFDNLLPDNPQIRARIQTQFQAKTNQPFDLLACIGKDCVGAIQLIEGEAITFKKEINAEPLSNKKLANILRNYQDFPLGMSHENDFRISVAGAQEKSAFLAYKNKWCRPIAETPTSHIFKLPIGILPYKQMDLSDSCENEWLCAKIAEAFGLPIAKCEILFFEDIKILSVERFDRKWSKDNSWLMRLPQEDICQALGVSPNLKYEADGGPGIREVMNLLLGSSRAEEDRDNFFRAQVLFWLLAAIDGHAKNFSLFIEPEGKYHLTPLYDIMSAYPLIAKKQLQKQKIKMAMALRSENKHYHWYNIQRRHFIATAGQVNYSKDKAEAILDDMLNKVDGVIEKISSILPESFPTSISQPIFTGMQSMKRILRI